MNDIEHTNETVRKFVGAYPIRRLGHGEQGIHMPVDATGTYLIYKHADGRYELVPVE